eukprot:TRINITY_DN7055_c0_g1_i1.p1 TRINITY_DN7055_c0_g1~~TRINITY_DN7055_c0_g1_i1.p1  ORF type:complete len:701 (+),score=219.25 TRINITY_DN7055_c0_g1_i1:46-2103(+)
MSNQIAPPTTGAEIYEAYHTIVSLARDINAYLQPPEVVLVGRKGCGKSTILESLFGHKFADVGNATLRPVEIKMVNNVDCEQPKITVVRDPEVAQFAGSDLENVPFLKVGDAIKERNVKSAVPIRIHYEYKYCWTMTFYDTPGLLPKTDSVQDIEENEKLVLSLMRPSDRLLVCVEEVTEWEKVEIADFASKVDPKHERTIFVFNKFSNILKNFASSRDLQSYWAGNPVWNSQVFFTTLPRESGRSDNPNLYKRRLAQLVKGDKDELEKLQYDQKYEQSIGITALHRCILEKTWKKYQEYIPEILKRLRVCKVQAQENYNNVSNHLELMETSHLRCAASAYLSEFVQVFEELLQGSLEGKPALCGKTLLEEKAQDDAGEWRDADSKEILFDPVAWNIPSSNSRLYGGQEMERLLAEFKTIVERTANINISQHEVATALGQSKSRVAPDLIWAASDLSQLKSYQVLAPLVKQLVKRATCIMKNLAAITEKVLEGRRTSNQQRLSTSSTSSSSTTLAIAAASIEQHEYPFFLAFVRSAYLRHMNELAESCLQKCMDEFSCTQLVYWKASKTLSVPQVSPTDHEQIFGAVNELSRKLFADIVGRIKTNVMLKCYNFFLVAMQSQLPLALHGSVSTLGDAQLGEVFEVNITKAQLTATQGNWEQIINEFQKQEAAFLGATFTFSHKTFE